MQRSGGFTLVELAITLMVIGLLIGGVLKSQEIIDNVRVAKAVKQLHEYDVAIAVFKDTYKALPGDYSGQALPNCTVGPCMQNNNLTEDGYINGGSESQAFWMQLERAGLITLGSVQDAGWSNALSAKDPWGRIIEATSIGEANHLLIGAGRYTGAAITPSAFARMDQKMDDGKPLTGMLQHTPVGWLTYQSADYCYDSTTSEYLSSSDKLYCGANVFLKSLGDI